jgi:hypothetical protein
VSEDLFAPRSTQIGGKPQHIRRIASIPYKYIRFAELRAHYSLYQQDHNSRQGGTTCTSSPSRPEVHSKVVRTCQRYVGPQAKTNKRLDQHSHVRKVQTVFGADPPEDTKPTPDQISAIKMLDDLKLVPGVDFSLFGLHGRRATKSSRMQHKSVNLKHKPTSVGTFQAPQTSTLRSGHGKSSNAPAYSLKWDSLFKAAADPEYTTAKNFREKEVKRQRTRLLVLSESLHTNHLRRHST